MNQVPTYTFTTREVALLAAASLATDGRAYELICTLSNGRGC